MNEKIKIIKSILLANIKNRFYKLNFAVTSACNSRCKTCDVWQEYQRNPLTVKTDLSLEEIEKIFKNLPQGIAWLSLSGGEPFLRKDLVEITESAIKNLPSLSLISIPSNGLLTGLILKQTREILKLPIKNLYFNFSLDGPSKIHDKIRGVKGGYLKTWKTYQSILKLSQKEKKLHVNLETTISRFNLNYLEGFFKKLVKDDHKITVTIAHTGYLYKNLGKKTDFTKLNNDEEKLRSLIETIKRGLNPFSPVGLVERIYLNKIFQFYRNPKGQPFPCRALKSSLALDAKGNITPCFMWGKILGNIRDFDYDLKRFIKEKGGLIRETKATIERQTCPNCWTPCEAYQAIIHFLSGGFK